MYAPPPTATTPPQSAGTMQPGIPQRMPRVNRFAQPGMPTAPGSVTATPPLTNGSAQPAPSMQGTTVNGPMPTAPTDLASLHASREAAAQALSQNRASNGTDPTHVSIDPHLLDANGQFGQYQQSAYDNAMRTLNPQMQQQRAAFDQDMVSRGFAPGSQAYQDAYDNMMRSNNDLLGQAAFGSQAAGLAAQGQAFGQGLSQSQLANQLLIAREGNSTSRANSSTAASASRYATDANRAGNDQNYNLGLGRLGLDSSNSDVTNLVSLLNQGRDTTAQHNLAQQGDYNRNGGLLDRYNSNSAVPIDILGNQNAYNANQTARANQQDASNQSYAQMAAMLASMYFGG